GTLDAVMPAWGVGEAQVVTRTSLAIGSSNPVCSGSSEVAHVCVQLPPATPSARSTSSPCSTTRAASSPSFRRSATCSCSWSVRWKAALPGVDFGFGVGRFEDYGGPGFGVGGESRSGRPFLLDQPIVTSADAGGDDARNQLIVDALSRTAPGNGGDGPEAALEGLFQVATGAGFVGDGDGSTTGQGGAQPAGLLATEITPDVSGDVPAFSSLVPGTI